MNNQDFFSLLFDEGEQTCFSPDKYGVQLFQPQLAPPTATYFSINPLHTSRRDENVTKHRNILIEMDRVPLDEQIPLIENSDIPWSTTVYSGGKSYHFIISLYEPCSNKADYDDLVDRTYTCIGKDKIDTKVKNPSRFSRVPNVERPDTGQLQELKRCFYRVQRKDLEEWLNRNLPTSYKTKSNRNLYPNKFKPMPSGFTTLFIKQGAIKGEWNNALFSAACDLFRCGYTQDQVESALSKPTGFLDRHDLRTIESAYSTVQKDLL